MERVSLLNQENKVRDWRKVSTELSSAIQQNVNDIYAEVLNNENSLPAEITNFTLTVTSEGTEIASGTETTLSFNIGSYESFKISYVVDEKEYSTEELDISELPETTKNIYPGTRNVVFQVEKTAGNIYGINVITNNNLPEQELLITVVKRDGTVKEIFKDITADDSDGIKSVFSEIIDGKENSSTPETFSTGGVYYSDNGMPGHSYGTPIIEGELISDTVYSATVTPDKENTGFMLAFYKDYNVNNVNAVVSNLSAAGVTNSPYSGTNGYVSWDELPSIGISKDFYASANMIYGSGNPTITELSVPNNMKFTVTNIDDTNYKIDFVYELQVTVKKLQTTVVRNDDTTEIETKPISGLLQNVVFNVQEKVGTISSTQPNYDTAYGGKVYLEDNE